jgi:hypothetical protein
VAFSGITLPFSCTIYSKTCTELKLAIQGVPGVKVTILGFHSRADSESKMSYTHGSNLKWFRSYGVLKYIK